jgi:hypothetical protein
MAVPRKKCSCFEPLTDALTSSSLSSDWLSGRFLCNVVCDQSPSKSITSIVTSHALAAEAKPVVCLKALMFWKLTHFDAHFASAASTKTFASSRDLETLALTLFAVVPQ